MTYKRIPRRKSPRTSRPDAAQDGDRRDDDIHNEGKPDAMRGFRPGPGNTGSMDGSDETGRRQVNHKV